MFSSSAYGQLFDFTGTWRDFTVIGSSSITNTGPSIVNGNLALFPGGIGDFTGFPPGTVTGNINIADAVADNARNDARTVYNTILNTNYYGTRDLSTQDLGDFNGINALTPGVYSFSSSAFLTGTLQLRTTAPGQVFIFKIGSTLITAATSRVVITGPGADCAQVYWQVGSSATFGTATEFKGNVLADISITFDTGANLVEGRAFALTGAVTLDNNLLQGGPFDDCGLGALAESGVLYPDELTSIFQIGFSAAGAQNSNIQRHLELVRRGGGRSAPQAPYIPEQNDSKSGMRDSKGGMGDSKGGMRDSKGGLVDQTEASPQQDNLWSVYLEGTGASATVDPSSSANGYRFDTLGATLGADRRMNDNLVVGILGSYSTLDAELFNSGSIEGDSYKGAIYATLFKDGCFLDALAGGGYNSYETRRTTVTGESEGSPDGWELNAMLNGGYDIHRGKWTITPSASVAYTRITLNGFTETGSPSSLQFPTQSQDSLLTDVGVRVAYSTMVLGMVVTPQVRLSWQHEYLDSTQSLKASSLPGPSSVFTVSGPDMNRDRAVLSAGLDVQVTPTVNVYAHYDGQLGNSNYNYNSVTVGFMVNF